LFGSPNHKKEQWIEGVAARNNSLIGARSFCRNDSKAT